MKPYDTKDELVSVMSALWDRIMARPDILEPLTRSPIVARFRYSDFDATLYVDSRSDPPRYYWDPDGGNAFDVEMILTSSTNHQFWMQTLNVPLAIASRKVVAKGSVQEALKLIPALKPAFSLYPDVLREFGKGELLAPTVPSRRRFRLPVLFRRRKRDYDLNLLPRYSWPSTASASSEVPADRTDPAAPTPIELYRMMYRIRVFEQHLAEAFERGELPTEAIHLSIGQESVAAGVCMNLRDTDYLNTTHRGHGHVIAKGADLKGVMAELYGKAPGLCAGKGGSMHVTDRRRGILGANGIVGAGYLLGLGAGLAIEHKGTDDVSVVFAGDGSLNQGMFHEAANVIGLFRLPVLIVVENNLYGEFTPIDRHSAVPEAYRRAAAYGIPAERIDGGDVCAVSECARQLIAAVRAERAPRFLEIMTYRHHGHMEGDGQQYRSEEERKRYLDKDPLHQLELRLLQEGAADADSVDKLKREVEKEIQEAVFFAVNASAPDLDALDKDIFAPEDASLFDVASVAAQREEKRREVSVSQAVNEAIAEEMRRDPATFLWGEDVSLGGYFNVTQGLIEEFGPDRIIDTPISEYAIVGGSVGAAMTGMRPIAEILFADFLTCCMDPLLNQAAKLRFMTGGQVSIPLVVRTPMGSGIGMAAQHSQAMERFVFGVPGLLVVAPSDAFMAKGLLKAAIRSNNPVVFFEHKLLYANADPVPDGEYLLPLGRAFVAREGRDVTLVSYSLGVSAALDAAKSLADAGISAEVIDLATLYPLDSKTILDSVKKTGRLITIEEGSTIGGVGGEVVAQVATAGHGLLRAAPVRMAGPECPVPYARSLETSMLPNPTAIAETATKLMR